MKSGYKKVSCVKARFMEGILRYWVLALGLLSEAAIDGGTSLGEWEANFIERRERDEAMRTLLRRPGSSSGAAGFLPFAQVSCSEIYSENPKARKFGTS